MRSRYYKPGVQRAEMVQDLFATIARRYDLLNDLMSAGRHRAWKRRLIGRALTRQADPPVRVLDLCCGTGDLALAFGCEGPGLQVIGADFSHAMLSIARRRTKSASNRIAWVMADALGLPFPDRSFDVVSIGYGLRNLADLEAGLREIQRVLRPGGQLLSLDFGKPESRLWRGIYVGYLRAVLPSLGWAFGGDPETYAYVLVSLRHYPAQRGLVALMESCGYADCGYEELVGGAMAINFGRRPA